MAIKLSSARDDTDAQNSGDWSKPTTCPDLDVEFKVRGLNYTPFVIARDKARNKLARQFPVGIPSERWAPQIGRLIGEHLLFDQRGLLDDDGKVIPIDAIRDALTDPGHVSLRTWVLEAANAVGEANIEFIEDAVGN